MKFTIVVDAKNNNVNEAREILNEELRKMEEKHSITTSHITMGDDTNKEFFAVIRWCEDDVHQALVDRDILPTKENIQKVMERHDVIEENSIEEGWAILDCIISDLQYDEELTDDSNEA